MQDPEKSDSGIVATKPTNEAGRLAEEPAEPRPGTKGNADQQSTHRTQSRVRVTQALDRVREAARRRKKGQFTALLHHIDADTLRTAFYALKRKAAPGVDGVTWHDYEADLEPRVEALAERVHRGAYRPQPSRRTYIPKADGKQRPLAIAALEDKIVQGATVMALNAVYESDFCGFSYGFRPGRGPHDALDALSTAIKIRKVNWILDADIQNFFGAVSQSWLVRFLEHRVGDKRILRLIQKWLKAGILEDGIVTVDDRGTGQGSVICRSSPTSTCITASIFGLSGGDGGRLKATWSSFVTRTIWSSASSVAHRIADSRVLRLIERWLGAGVLPSPSDLHEA